MRNLSHKEQAKCWRYTQEKGYFHIPGDSSFQHVVGVQEDGQSINHSIQGTGGTLQEAVCDALGIEL